MLKPIAFAAAVAVSALATTASAATVELLTNGGFDDIGTATPEGWGGLTYYAGGPALLPGWTVEAGSVDLTDTSSAWGPAGGGQYSLDINGWSAGTIAQSFATVLGRLYTVSFNYSRNPANAPYTATATVSAGGQSLDVTALGDGAFGGLGSMAWQSGTFTFVGTGNTETIRLAATIPGNAGVFFDNVSVTAGVPEPSTWAIAIMGFGLMGAALRRRRMAAVRI
ncbi:PEPxxWA-CTERM sorting domain-containing protein [Phenylobacterium sp.]|uniref:PEPxxWA-CTERM sorting domain-containing protein n=1 Tax=Phenylobacterium sp. TaxID=1871053 RepID=UPI0025E1A018|nr:PEPxxWA-CTERM sorting domain-containing protein [Phenylobacterium sp.]MBX3483676.1 PEPxxWA-CTERM sorting domain-containing protein [Phenylobacterium sp.]